MGRAYRRTCAILAILMISASLPGCAEGNVAPADSDQPSAAAPSLETPEDLARFVHACILSNDFEAYKHVCVNLADVEAVLSFAQSDREREGVQQFIDTLRENPAMLERGQREGFDKIALTVHAHGVYDVEFVSATPRARDQVRSELDSTQSIKIHLTNGQAILIRSPFKINGRWTIGMDSWPRYIESAPQDRDHQVAENFSAQSMTIVRHPEADKVQEQMLMRDVSVAFISYAVENRNRWPDHAEDTLEFAPQGRETFVAAADNPDTTPLTRGPETPAEPYTYGSFTFMPLAGIGMSEIRRPSEFPIAYSHTPRVGDGEPYRVVGYMDGHTEAVPETDFQTLLAESLAELERYRQ